MRGLLAFFMATALLIGSVSSQGFGICVEMCGPFGSVQCPQGYECRSNGCGHTCQKVTMVKEECQPVMCEIFCVNGWKKNEKGCDICACA